MLILALDPATTTGAAWLHMDTIRTAVWSLTGKRCGHLNTYLQEFADWYGYPDHLIFERTKQASKNSILQDMQGSIVGWAESNNVDWSCVLPTQWKKAVLGKGNATKKECLEWSEKFLGTRLDQNEADAVCILQYYKGV